MQHIGGRWNFIEELEVALLDAKRLLSVDGDRLVRYEATAQLRRIRERIMAWHRKDRDRARPYVQLWNSINQ